MLRSCWIHTVGGALLLNVLAVASAQAEIVVASFAGNSLLRFDETTGAALGTLVASGSGGLNQPAGLTMGPDGYIYVSSQASNEILKYSAVDGSFQGVFASLGAGYNPAGLRFGQDGNLYVSKYGGGTVDRFNGISGAFINSVITGLTQPTGLTFDANGVLYASNFAGGSVVKYDGIAQSDFIAAGSSPLLTPSGTTFGPDGNFYAVDLFAGAILRYNPLGGFMGVFASDPSLIFPSDLLFDVSGNLLVAVLGPDFNPTGSIQKFNGTTGAYIGSFATGILTASQILSTPVPEPGTLALTAVGLLVPAAAWVRRRRSAKALGSGEVLPA